MSNNNLIMTKDTIIYMIAKIFEGIIGVLTISVMSYIYYPGDIGKYSTLNIAVTTISMVCIQWLIQSSIRYVNKYIVENKEKEFFSTVTISWLKVNLIVSLFLFILIFILRFTKNIYIVNFLESYHPFLLISGIFMFVGYNTFQLVIALLAGVRKAKINLLLSVLNVTGKLALIYIFNKIFFVNIVWIFLSYGLIDILTSIIGINKLKIQKNVSFNKNSKEILSVLKVYGLPLMGNMIATSILNKSDIYIITGKLGEFSAGVYQTNYSIIASAFTLLSTGAMRGSYPTILKAWGENNKQLTENLISQAVRTFLLITVPSVFGIFALSDFVSTSLFESSYIEGNSIMGFVALGMLFLGLTEYAIKAWELKAKTNSIFKRSLFCGMLNIVLNVFLLNFFSYKVCAINTFVSFFIYFIIAKLGTRKYIKWNLEKKVYVKITFSSFVMLIILIKVKSFFSPSFLTLAFLVFLGVVIYFTVLFLTGEIKKEVISFFKKFVKNIAKFKV